MICLRHRDIILESSGNGHPEGMDHAQRFIAVPFLVRIENDPEGRQIVDFVKIDALILHLFVYAVKMFGPPFHFPGNSKADHFPLDDSLDLLGVLRAFFLLLRDPFGQFIVRIKIEVSESQVFQLRLHPVDPQTICQRRVQFQSFFGDIPLAIRGLKFEGSHVVDSIGQANQKYSDV